MFNIILSMHILGAVFVGAVMLIALRDLYQNKTPLLPTYVRNLSFGLFFEIGSGSMLALLAPSASLVAFCQNIALYAVIIFFGHFVIYRKLASQGNALNFPTRFVGWVTLATVASAAPVFVTLLS